MKRPQKGQSRPNKVAPKKECLGLRRGEREREGGKGKGGRKKEVSKKEVSGKEVSEKEVSRKEGGKKEGGNKDGGKKEVGKSKKGVIAKPAWLSRAGREPTMDLLGDISTDSSDSEDSETSRRSNSRHPVERENNDDDDPFAEAPKHHDVQMPAADSTNARKKKNAVVIPRTELMPEITATSVQPKRKLVCQTLPEPDAPTRVGDLRAELRKANGLCGYALHEFAADLVTLQGKVKEDVQHPTERGLS